MQGFISYAHYDYKAFTRAAKHISHVARAFKIDMWSDTRIKAGNYWSPKIQAEIAKSDLFVLLVTNDFLGSDYIFDRELPAIIDQHKNRGALLVPIILRPCGWKLFFGDYIQAVPGDGAGGIRPALDWPKPENGLAAAADAFGQAVADWFGLVPATPFDALKGKTP